MPNTAAPLRVSAISEPHAGMPVMNDFVPSIGSSTQTYSASVFSSPYSSPTIPCSGKLRLISVRIAVSAARSAAVTGSKPAAEPLSSTPSEVRKNGRIASPDTVASLSTKAAKSMAVMREIQRRGAGLAKSGRGSNRRLASRARACHGTLPGEGSARQKSFMRSPVGRSGSHIVPLVGALAAIYLVSQFLRNSVGVIAPDLAAEIGLSASDIGLLSSAFFFAFAAAQLPLGIAIDRYGPKRCMLVCAVIALIGTIEFAFATTPAGLITARVLMGLGSSCYLMAPLALYARRFPPERFTVLAGIQLSIGTIGTLFVTAPLAWASAAIGWRTTFLVVAGLLVACAIMVAIVVREERGDVDAAHGETLRESLAGVLEVARMRGFAPLFLMHTMSYSSY